MFAKDNDKGDIEMEIVNNKEIMVFKSEDKGNVYYSLGVSKKDIQGNYVNGYVSCRFKKGIELENRTRIKIKSAWLDFYLKDKKTITYVFVNDFEKVAEPNPYKEMSIKTQNDIGEQIKIEDSDLPFDPDEELPF